MRFNSPPSWPVPDGWEPEPDWQPPADWEPAPEGWAMWVDDDSTAVESAAPRSESQHSASSARAGGPAEPRAGSGDAPPQPVLPTSAPMPGVAEAERSAVESAPTVASTPTPPPSPLQGGDGPSPPTSLRSKALHHPIWTTLGAILGIVGLVLSGIEIYQKVRTDPADLEVVYVTIDSQQPVRGTLDGQSVSVGLTPIELTLQNRGGEPSLITKVDAEVVFFQQLTDCTGAASQPGTIDVPYALSIPMDGAQPRETRFSSEVRVSVEPGVADRVVVTLGPQSQPGFDTQPMVMSVRLTLAHEDGQSMDVGTVSVVTTVDAAGKQIDGLAADLGRVRSCARQNLEHLDTMFAIQARRSAVLESLRSAYQAAV